MQIIKPAFVLILLALANVESSSGAANCMDKAPAFETWPHGGTRTMKVAMTSAEVKNHGAMFDSAEKDFYSGKIKLEEFLHAQKKFFDFRNDNPDLDPLNRLGVEFDEIVVNVVHEHRFQRIYKKGGRLVAFSTQSKPNWPNHIVGDLTVLGADCKERDILQTQTASGPSRDFTQILFHANSKTCADPPKYLATIPDNFFKEVCKAVGGGNPTTWPMTKHTECRCPNKRYVRPLEVNCAGEPAKLPMLAELQASLERSGSLERNLTLRSNTEELRETHCKKFPAVRSAPSETPGADSPGQQQIKEQGQQKAGG